MENNSKWEKTSLSFVHIFKESMTWSKWAPRAVHVISYVPWHCCKTILHINRFIPSTWRVIMREKILIIVHSSDTKWNIGFADNAEKGGRDCWWTLTCIVSWIPHICISTFPWWPCHERWTATKNDLFQKTDKLERDPIPRTLGNLSLCRTNIPNQLWKFLFSEIVPRECNTIIDYFPLSFITSSYFFFQRQIHRLIRYEVVAIAILRKFLCSQFEPISFKRSFPSLSSFFISGAGGSSFLLIWFVGKEESQFLRSLDDRYYFSHFFFFFTYQYLVTSTRKLVFLIYHENDVSRQAILKLV